MKRPVLLVSVAVLLVPWFADGAEPPSAQEVEKILGDMSQLAVENTQIETKLEENRKERASLRGDLRTSRSEGTALRDEGQRYKASGCGRTFKMPKERAEYNRCESWRSNLQPRLDRWKNRAKELQGKMRARVGDMKALRARRQVLLGRMGTLRNLLLKLKSFQLSNRRCDQERTLEAMHQCMQSIWDRARSAHDADPMVVKPPMVIKPRTPEQAIEDYKKSGPARPGPQTLKPKEVPPPAKPADK